MSILQKNLHNKGTLLKHHLRATQHHSFVIDDNDKEPNEDADDDASDDVDRLPNIEDGSCLIPSMDKFLESVWDITYE